MNIFGQISWITLVFGWQAAANAQFYTDTGSPANPAWSAILPTLNNNSADPGPVPGSVINVNNTATEVGIYGNRPISVGAQRIHVCCNTSTPDLTDFTRWFQTDGKTQVFRLFVNDENTASTRVGAARCEAFIEDGWTYADNVTYEWTGRYTIAKRQQGYAIFQLFNLDNEWALQLSMSSTGGLTVNNRRNAADVTLTNPDGSTKDFDGKGFDVRVIDDGLNYKCWIDGVLVADNFYDRPTAISRFRWGKYMGDNILTAPSDVSIILVSGAQVRSWPGRLDAATTNIVKANNTQNLGNTGSWSGGVVPGINNRAVWNSTVAAVNSTTLNTDLTWAGIRITNPVGTVTIDGAATLKLEDAGLDMSTATSSLVVGCPVELNVTAPWVINAGRVATLNDSIRGYGGITLSGGGRLILNAPNTYSGPTTINGGILQLGNGGTNGALDTDSVISVASGAIFAVDQSDTVAQGAHFSGAAITGDGGLEKSGTGTLTMTASNTYTGSTTIREGTLQLGNGGTTGTLSASSAISIASGATFAVNRSNTPTQGIGFSGAPITGAGELEKLGAGILTLLAANSYTGLTTISAGTLQLGNGGTSGALSPSSAISIASGATLAVNRSNAVTQGTDFSAAAITGTGELEKLGTGILTLLAANSYTGLTTISAGTLQLGNGGTSGALSPSSAISIASGATLAVNRSNAVTQGTDFSAAAITGAGGLTNSGNGTVTLTAANTYSGATIISAGTLQLGNGGTTGALSTSSSISVASGATFAVNRSNTISQGTNFSGAAITGNGGLAKSGVGILTLSAANTYSGSTAINAGVLAFSNVSPFDHTTSITLSGGALLRPTVGGATINAPIQIGSVGTTAFISAPTNAPGAGALSSLSLDGPISGAGDVAFTSSVNQNALSTILLNAKSNYAGNTLLDTEGTTNTQVIVKLGIANALPTTTVLKFDGQIGDGTGRFADLNLNGFSQQLAGLTNTDRSLRTQRIVNSNASALAMLTINNASPHIYSGSLGGGAAGSVSASAMPGSTDGNNFAFTKGGVGTLTLSGSNTYSGDTTINQGTLSLGSANGNNQNATVTIATSGATLNLSFAGTDIVKELYIGATLMPAGVYESVGNPGSGIEIPQITGTGTLTVTTGSVGYGAWKIINGTNQPMDGDHDNDGVSNGIEHFLGGNGNTAGSTQLPSVANNAGVLSITWTVGNGYPGTYGNGFVIETSDSLTGTWATEISAPAPTATVTFPSANTVKYTFPAPTSGKKFVRLKVTTP